MGLTSREITSYYFGRLLLSSTIIMSTIWHFCLWNRQKSVWRVQFAALHKTIYIARPKLESPLSPESTIRHLQDGWPKSEYEGHTWQCSSPQCSKSNSETFRGSCSPKAAVRRNSKLSLRTHMPSSSRLSSLPKYSKAPRTWQWNAEIAQS